MDRSIRTKTSWAYVGRTATAPMYKNPPATKGITCQYLQYCILYFVSILLGARTRSASCTVVPSNPVAVCRTAAARSGDASSACPDTDKLCIAIPMNVLHKKYLVNFFLTWVWVWQAYPTYETQSGRIKIRKSVDRRTGVGVCR